jgi:thiamine-monophosphate kinase
MTAFTEDELVAAIRRILTGPAPGVLIGIGDDAAVVELGSHSEILTSDMLVEGIHFDRRTTSPRDLGYKAIAVNVSDVAAMGGGPRYAMASLGLPSDAEAAWVMELYGGMREAADEYAVPVVGGDTSRADRIVLSVAMTGEVPDGGAVGRSGARAGDRIVVTGVLGAAAGGLALSTADPHAIGAVLGTDWARDLLGAHLRPHARVAEGQALARAGATAMIDVSDGLAKDLGRLCRESGVGAALDLSRIPLAPALEDLAKVLPVEPLTLAMEGGEDYELLATLRPVAVEGAVAALEERFTPLSTIGEITAAPGIVSVEPDGLRRPVRAGGWDHFAS